MCFNIDGFLSDLKYFILHILRLYSAKWPTVLPRCQRGSWNRKDNGSLVYRLEDTPSLHTKRPRQNSRDSLVITQVPSGRCPPQSSATASVKGSYYHSSQIFHKIFMSQNVNLLAESNRFCTNLGINHTMPWRCSRPLPWFLTGILNVVSSPSYLSATEGKSPKTLGGRDHHRLCSQILDWILDK